MARKRYQRGWLEWKEDTGQAWARWREDVIEPDTGKLRRPKRRKYLGVFKTKRLALREVDKAVALADVNNPNYRPRMEATFEVFAERWIRDVLSQHKPSTQAGDRSRMKVHILPYFRTFAVRDITAFDVQAFISQAKVGAKSKRNLKAALSMMHTTAKAWRLTNVDWFDGLVLPEWMKPESASFSLDEAIRIIDGAEDPYQTFYWIAAETGMRLGECCALRPRDFVLDTGIVVVRWSAWHGIVTSTKSKKPRIFSISTKLAAQLREFIKGIEPAAYIFHREDGSPWVGDWDVVETHLKPMLRKLEIPNAGLHAFRHGNASLMDRMNVPLKVRQDRLGHLDGEQLTLGVYTHAQSEDHKQVADELGEMLRPTIQWPKMATGMKQ